MQADESVQCRVELLEVLPAEEMSRLLRAELARCGYDEKDGLLVRRDGDLSVTVDAESGNVTVALMQKVARGDTIEMETEVVTWDDRPRAARPTEDLATLASDFAAEVSRRLEGRLRDVSAELDGIVNRVTILALKQKAASLGQIKELSEDPRTGSLSITVEV